MVIGEYEVIDRGNKVEVIYKGKSEELTFDEFRVKYKMLASEIARRTELWKTMR